MALKQRKQITGTTEQINQYAGVEGQLVWDKSAKTLVGMSGTAGKNYPLAPKELVVNEVAKVDTKKADKTYVDQELAKKQPTGDYATRAELNAIPKTEPIPYGNKGGNLESIQTTETTDQFNALDLISTDGSSNLVFTEEGAIGKFIPRSGSRGTLSGYEVPNTEIDQSVGVVVDGDSPDVQYYEESSVVPEYNVSVFNGKPNTSWTKVVYLTSGDLLWADTAWKWAGGKIPDMKFPCILIFHWNHLGGIANYVSGVA